MDAGDVRGRPGGIFELLDLINRYPEELTYDWMTRFGLPLAALTDGRIGWMEGYLLTRALLRDPSTRIQAAMAEWAHPFSHEARILADLYDALVAVNTDKKHKSRIRPYPRPWPDENWKTSAPPKASQAEVRAALARRGH